MNSKRTVYVFQAAKKKIIHEIEDKFNETKNSGWIKIDLNKTEVLWKFFVEEQNEEAMHPLSDSKEIFIIKIKRKQEGDFFVLIQRSSESIYLE